MAIYGKTQTENGLECSKPLKFDVTAVESCFEWGSAGYSQNSKNSQNGQNGPKMAKYKKLHLIIKLWLILSIWFNFCLIWTTNFTKNCSVNIEICKRFFFLNGYKTAKNGWSKLKMALFVLNNLILKYDGQKTLKKQPSIFARTFDMESPTCNRYNSATVV